MNKNRIVILGSKGFVAEDLIFLLKKKKLFYKSFSKKKINLENDNSFIKLKKEILSKDKIVFISAKAPVRNNYMFVQNLKIVINVVKSLINKRFSQLIYISSDAVYKDTKKKITEKSECDPNSLHGNMHLIREKILEYYFRDRLCILRPTLIYGKRDPHNGYGPNSFLRLVEKRKNILLFGKGEEMRDHIFINDVSKIILFCLKNNFKGMLNLASGKIIKFLDIAILCIKKNSSNSKIKFIRRNGPPPHLGHREFNIKKLKKTLKDFKFNKLNNYIKNY